MVTATPHEDLEAYFADRDDDCRYCNGSGEREMSDTTCGPDCHTQLASCPYCLGTGARMDCLPVPADRHQGWPGVYAVLYTDSINGEQACRDDLWITTGKAIRCVTEKAQTNAYAEGRSDEADERAWKPIETAPEDEHILIATTGGHVGTAYWTDDGDGKVWAWGHPEKDNGQYVNPNLDPLGWMPLPKHPEKS